MGNIEIGAPCHVTCGEIKQITADVFCFLYDNKFEYVFINRNGKQIELDNGKIDWSNYIGFKCNIWGDFLPPKLTRTGKIIAKFLVLRIEKAPVEDLAFPIQRATPLSFP